MNICSLTENGYFIGYIQMIGLGGYAIHLNSCATQGLRQ